MAPYIYKRNREGIHIFNLGKTWEKLMLAARIIAAIPNPKDILVSYSLLAPQLLISMLFFLSNVILDRREQSYNRSYQTESMHKEQS